MERLSAILLTYSFLDRNQRLSGVTLRGGINLGLFKSKEEKLQERLREEKKREEINNILVSTLPSCNKPYKIIGIVSSDLGSAENHISVFMDEIKLEAYMLGADAVIGITFQTSSISRTHQINSDYDTHIYSEIMSKAVGTAIKYI